MEDGDYAVTSKEQQDAPGQWDDAMLGPLLSVPLLFSRSGGQHGELSGDSGVRNHIRQQEHWSIYLPETHRGAHPPAWIGHWKGDEILTSSETAAIAAVVRKSGLPAVDLSA